MQSAKIYPPSGTRDLVLLLLVMVSLPALSACITPAVPFHQFAVNFLSDEWSSIRYDSPGASQSLALLQAQTNSSWITLTYCHYQWSVSTPGPIYPIVNVSASSRELTSIISLAHSRGMKVMLRPLVDPDWSNPANSGKWRGEIGANFTPSKWSAWFSSYSDFIYESAQLASRTGADQFSIGGELVASDSQSLHWRAVAARVREVYSGPIIYGANWGNEGVVEWWDAVDAIAVDAYYPLNPDKATPSVADLVTAWQPIKTSLLNLSHHFGDKPIIFSEVGYCSSRGANVDPAHGGAGLDLQAQADLYTALFEVWLSEPAFAGLHLWAWLAAPDGGGGQTDTGFSPASKPAAAIMMEYSIYPKEF